MANEEPQGRGRSPKYTFQERKMCGLDLLRYLKTENIICDGIPKNALRDAYNDQYKVYRTQIAPDEKLPNFYSVYATLLKSRCLHMKGNRIHLGAEKKQTKSHKNSNKADVEQPVQSPKPTRQGSTSPKSSPAVKNQGPLQQQQNSDENGDFSKGKVIQPKRKRVRAKVAVDQHIPYNKEIVTQTQTSREPSQSPSRVCLDNQLMVCTICQARCTSRADLAAHVRGRKHRIAVVMDSLKNRRSELIQDKFGVIVTMAVKDKEGTYYLDLDEGEEIYTDLSIQNRGEETVELIHCEMMKKIRVFQFTDPQKVTDCLETVTLRPEEKYSIRVRTQAQHVGNFHVPVALQFRVLSSGAEFHIIRFLHARCINSTIEELKQGTPYRRPPRAVQGHETVELVPGRKMPRLCGDDLERVIELEFYDIPVSTRRIINRGLKDTKDKLNQGEKLELTTLRHTLESTLDMKSFPRRFETLLQFEEVQMEVDIRKYDMSDVTMKTCPEYAHLLLLEVPGLAENRPSVLRGDCLYVRILSDGVPGKKEYQGYVHEVRQNEVALGFSESLMCKFVPNMKFNVRFVFSRLPLRLQHRACHLAQEMSMGDILFPEARHIPKNVALPEIRLCNADLETNKEQKSAVQHIVAGSSGTAPYIVFGPPGTGKTVTIVEAMNQICRTKPDCHILACAPSNSAADLIAKRLLKHKAVSKSDILRLNAVSRNWASVPEDIKSCCNFNKTTRHYFYPRKKDLSQYKIVITTLVTAGRIASANFPPGHFSHVFIDEAGHAVEPEALIALAGIVEPNKYLEETGHVIIAGDPKQLGPVLRSPFAIKYGLEMSLLERYMETCDIYQPSYHGDKPAVYDVKVITKLLKNYRSHPAILKPSNEMFYKSELIACASIDREKLCKWEGLPKRGFPVIFHSVIGQDQREERSPSFFNPEEASIVIKYVEELMQARSGGINLKQGDIGVISPYWKQVQKIQRLLRKKKYDKISVGSVEEFQGQERTVIIVSTVRSNPEYMSMDTKFKLGFLKNPKRFNVTMTRAKALLVVIGNPQTLCKDEHWKRFIQYCKENGGFTGTETLDEEEEAEDLVQRLQAVNLFDNNDDHLLPEVVSQYNEQPWRKDE